MASEVLHGSLSKSNRGNLGCVATTRKRRRIAFSVIILIALAQGAEGFVAPELESIWTLRRSKEAEVYVMAGMLSQITNKLWSVYLAKEENRKERELYVEAGRAIKLCSALQHHISNASRYKRGCHN